jgi:surfactin synthase thioesterase subunit
MTTSVRSGRSRRYLLRRPEPGAAARLFCLPYSGSGASSYHRWPRLVGRIEVCPVQLPGREVRIRDPLFGSYEDLADDLITGLAPYLDRPFGLFGHCGSALACYEMALRLDAAGGPQPACLFVSSEVAPHEGPYGRFLTMDDDDLRAELSGQLGAEEQQPDFFAAALRVLRSDLAANRRYRKPEPVPVACPVTVLGWTDDVEVPVDLIGGWSAYGRVTHRRLSGAHDSYLSAPPELLSAVVADMSAGAGQNLA